MAGRRYESMKVQVRLFRAAAVSDMPKEVAYGAQAHRPRVGRSLRQFRLRRSPAARQTRYEDEADGDPGVIDRAADAGRVQGHAGRRPERRSDSDRGQGDSLSFGPLCRDCEGLRVRSRDQRGPRVRAASSFRSTVSRRPPQTIGSRRGSRFRSRSSAIGSTGWMSSRRKAKSHIQR